MKKRHHMSPIRSAQHTTLALAATALIHCAGVQAQTLPAALQVCADDPEDRQRLACYDREIAKLRALPNAPDVAAPSPTAAFGLRGPITTQEKTRQAEQQSLDQIIARIAHLDTQPRGEYILTLDNDQVWEQTSAASSYHLAIGEQVTIKRGLLGSFTLINSSRRTISVTRRR